MQWMPALSESPVCATALAGELLLQRGTAPTQASYLKLGRVAAGLMEGGKLRHHILTIEGPCWLEVGASLFRWPCAADWVAETEVTLWQLPGEALRKWFASQPVAMRHLVKDTARMQREQSDAALGLQVKDAEARFAQWLLRHAKVLEEGHLAVSLGMPKRAIAAQLSVAPETLSRVLRRLRDLGLVSQSGSVMNLIDPGRLQALAGV